MTQNHLYLDRGQQCTWMVLAYPSDGLSPRQTKKSHRQENQKERSASKTGRAVDECIVLSLQILDSPQDSCLKELDRRDAVVGNRQSDHLQAMLGVRTRCF